MDEKRQNREIKFRAWNAKEQLMSDPFGLIRGTLIWRKKGETAVTFASLFPEYIIMQYTGLKDNNGKEIYEGDVIEYTKETFPEDSDVLVYITKRDRIVFSGGQFQASKSCFGWVGEDLIYLPTSTVIGNIYENPELSES